MTTTTVMNVKAREWLLENEAKLVNFENAFIQAIRNKGIPVDMVEGLESGGQLSYYVNPETGMAEEPHILLPARLLERQQGLDQAIVRIITVAHEVGHWADIQDYYGGSGVDFAETEVIIQEQDAWDLAIKLLDVSGFDQFGYMGWRTVRNMIRTYLATYYYERCDNDIAMARKEAKEFANLLLQFKKEKFAAEREAFMSM
jgi:hypothetical protein